MRQRRPESDGCGPEATAPRGTQRAAPDFDAGAAGGTRVMTRKEGLGASAAVIARHVPDLAGLALALDAAGQRRLAAALRARVEVRPAEVRGEVRPYPLSRPK